MSCTHLTNFCLAVALIAIGACCPPADGALVIANGSFEAPDLASGGAVQIPIGGTVESWTTDAGSSQPSYILDENFNTQIPAASDGTQMLQIDHRSNPHLVYQSLGTTDAASDVTLSAQFAARDLNATPIPASMTFQLLLLTGTPGSFSTLADSGVLSHSALKTWVEHSVAALNVPTGTQVFVGLRANNVPGTLGILTLVDDVQLTVSPVSVPAPAALPAGLVMLSVYAMRRHRAVSRR